MKELKLTANPAFTSDASKAGSDVLLSEYICPVTGLEMNGRYKYVLRIEIEKKLSQTLSLYFFSQM